MIPNFVVSRDQLWLESNFFPNNLVDLLIAKHIMLLQLFPHESECRHPSKLQELLIYLKDAIEDEWWNNNIHDAHVQLSMW